MKVFNLLTACVIAASLSFVSCSDDALTTSGVDAEGFKISFSLGVSAGPDCAVSRDDKDSWENGKYYDMGLDGERHISNAMIVVYDRPLNYTGDDGKVVKVFYIDAPGPFTPSKDKGSASYFDPVPSYYPQTDVLNRVNVGSTMLSDACTQTFEVKDEAPLQVGKRYYAIALCNLGDMTSTFEGKPLKEFRDYVYKGDLYEHKDKDIKGYTNFAMSGINEESFIWERKTQGTLDLGSYLVQRMTARVDLSLGDPVTEFVNQATYTTDGFIQLAVYTQAEGSTEYAIQTTDDGTPKFMFYLTDVQIVKAVNNGMYLIERSSPHSPSYRDENNQPPQPVYLDNEGWLNYTDFAKRRATKYVFCPPGKSYNAEPYSLWKKSGYESLCDLISAGSFYNTDTYANKKNSTLVGYIPENTCSENNYTMLRIEGYTNASTSAIFTGSRAGFNPSEHPDFKHVVGDIPIMHNTAEDSHVMDYAVVRNTIYRLRVKVLANDNKIYFRWYYVEPGATGQKEYDVACFYKDVADNNEDNPEIND